MQNVTVRSPCVASPLLSAAEFGPSGLDEGAPTPGHHQQILIVEDDGDIANVMAELLELAGFSVVLASEATFGLAALRTRQFAVVLSDQRMPGQTGVDMLLAARAEGLLDGVAALILSADELSGLQWRALRKPILFEELLVEIHLALARVRRVPPATAALRDLW
jgi:DNA-binding response OmpR family regulator